MSIANKRPSPSTYTSNEIFKEGIQETLSLIFERSEIWGISEQKKLNKVTGTTSVNHPVCIFLAYLLKNGISIATKNGSDIL